MRRSWVVILALAIITAAVYWRVSGYDFVNYDDNDYVTANPHVQAGLTKSSVAWAFGNLHGEKTYWHPLTWLSHMLDCQLFGTRPGAHHLVNLFLHALNASLLFLVLKRMTGAHCSSAIVAALFALHPLQVDTVAWVAERKNLLCALFWILALAAYTRYAEKPSVGRYVLVFACMAAGLLAKPVLVTLPCALLLLDYWPLRRFGSAAPSTNTTPPAFARTSFGSLLLEKLPLVTLSIASIIITLQAHAALEEFGEGQNLPLQPRVENALVSYARYLGKVFWPDNLAVLYLHPGVWPAATVAASVALLLALTTLAGWQARRRPWFLVGWLWFLGVLVPTIGLRQAGIQAMADRFAYLPSIGLYFALVWGFAEFVARRRWRPASVAAATSGVLAALAVTSTLQLRHWQNSVTLWEQAVRVEPHNFVAHGNLSAAWKGAGDLQKSREHALEVTRLRPSSVEARLQLGFLAVLLGDLDGARGQYREALQLRPSALPEIRKIAEGLFGERNWAAAVAQFTLYLEAAPQDLKVRGDRAYILPLIGRPAEAAAEYQELLKLQPDWPEVLNNLAWMRATFPKDELRNSAEAVRLAERAVEITGRRQSVYFGTLAAAYAEAGRFDDAIKAGETARDLALKLGQVEIAKTNERLLEFYRAGKPFHQEPF